MSEKGPSLFVVILRYLVNIERIFEHLPEHYVFLDKNYAEGIFLASGPQKPIGGLILAKADNRDTLMDVLVQDPFYQHKLVEFQVYECNPTKYSKMFEGLFAE